jgi:Tol biopolymer transport system component
MKNTLIYLRRAAGVILLAALALLFVLLARLAMPGQTPPVAYPGPGETSTPTATHTPTPTATLPPYPPPGGQGSVLPTATPEPTLTPTSTPWPVSALPIIKTYPLPGPFQGMRFIYGKPDPPGIYVINVDGTGEMPLEPWPWEQINGVNTNLMRTSPDGSKILYTLQNDMQRDIASIWTMKPDSSQKTLLVDPTGPFEYGNCFPEDAIWSPDGAQIAYRILCLTKSETGEISGYRQLWVMGHDGKNPHLVSEDPQLSNIAGGDLAHVFRWMGNGYIYFATDLPGTSLGDLFAVNPKDGQVYRLLDGVDALYLGFTLSPDGQHAWGFTEVPVESLRAAGFQTIDLPVNYGMVWSPDGSRLAYVAAGTEGTWLQDLASGKERQLLPYKTGEDIRLKAFSPDNRYLAYQTDAGIYVFDLESEPAEPKLVLADPHEPISGYRALDFLAWLPVR